MAEMLQKAGSLVKAANVVEKLVVGGPVAKMGGALPADEQGADQKEAKITMNEDGTRRSSRPRRARRRASS